MDNRYPFGTSRRRFFAGVLFASILYAISILIDSYGLGKYRFLIYLIWGFVGILIYYRFQSWFENK